MNLLKRLKNTEIYRVKKPIMFLRHFRETFDDKFLSTLSITNYAKSVF